MSSVDDERETRLAALRRDIGEAIAQMERGESIDGEEAFAEILRALERDEEL